jgi:uncharacterized protein YbjT (DUF2867 family)
MKKKTVAVVGATGQQGGAVLHALLQRHEPITIRALTRHPKGRVAHKLASHSNVEICTCDMNDPASLDEAFKGTDAVFGMTDFWKGAGGDPIKEKQQGINLVDAAMRQGVKHFVFSSLEDTRPRVGDKCKERLMADMTVPHFDAKNEVEKYMFESFNQLYQATAVYPGIFMENLLPGQGLSPQKQENGSYTLYLPTGDAKLAWTTVEDIGGVVAAVIADGPEKWGGKIVGVSGEHASTATVADLMSQMMDIKVTAATPSPEEWTTQVVKGGGLSEEEAKDYRNMFIYYKECPDMLDLRPVEKTRELYPGAHTFKEWLEEHKKEFATEMVSKEE